MRDLDLRVIRVGEFTWRREMKVIFCTPTATLLVWITERYPEILNCDINGVSYQDGERRRYNTNKKENRICE